MGKAPSFQFYPADWLKDPKLKRCSYRAKGVWIDLNCNAFECPLPGVFRDENGPFSEREIVAMLTGKQREKRLGFEELKDRKVLKQLEDNSYYCKRLYEICRISRLRKTAGKKGGNPALLLKQQVNQSDNQNLTPSSSSSSSVDTLLRNVSKNQLPPEAADADQPFKIPPEKQKHWKGRVGDFFMSIKTSCEVIKKFPRIKKTDFNPFMWVQDQCNQQKHPGAIEETIKAIADPNIWMGIKIHPYGYANSIIKTKVQNWNEKEAIKIHKRLKKMAAPDIEELTHGVWGGFE